MIVYGSLFKVYTMIRINGRTFYSIWKDAQKYRIIVYTDNNKNAEFIKDKLKLIDVKIDYFVTEDNKSFDHELKFRNVYDLIYENPEEIMVVVLGSIYYSAYKILTGIGLKPGDDFKWIGRYGFENINAKYSFDPTLGCNIVSPDTRFPGFFVYGNPENINAKRIVTLGGSTSDPSIYYFRNWSELLYKKFNDYGIETVIFAGGVAGFSSSQELLKLIRDVPQLNPTAVINYSGVNNVYLLKDYPFLIEYQLEICRFLEEYPDKNSKIPDLINRSANKKTTLGIKMDTEKIDKYNYWINHKKLMKCFSDIHGFKFLCFLQPNLLSMEKEKIRQDDKEYLLNRSFMGKYGITPEMYSQNAMEFRKRIKSDKNKTWLFDLSTIFDDDIDGIYLDAIHVSEKGNEIIAQKILEIMLKTFKFNKRGIVKI